MQMRQAGLSRCHQIALRQSLNICKMLKHRLALTPEILFDITVIVIGEDQPHQGMAFDEKAVVRHAGDRQMKLCVIGGKFAQQYLLSSRCI